MKAFTVVNVSAILAASAFLCAGVVVAQTPASAQAALPVQASESASTAPLELQLPPQDPPLSRPFGGADSPGEYYGDHSGGDRSGDGGDGSDKSVQVHGSFTTGVGYSKGYGTSTTNAADLNISKQYDDGKTVDMHIHLEQSKGPGFYPYGGYYGPRYRGY